LHSEIFNEFVLLFCPFFAYYALHVILWWQGLGGSLGLIRVIAAVIPPLAFFGVKGFSFIIEKVRNYKWLQIALTLIIIAITIYTPFVFYKFPVPLGEADKVVGQATDWVKQNDYSKHEVCFFDIYYCFKSNTDPYDITKIQQGLDRDNPSQNIEAGATIIWDSHYGPNEGKIPLPKLMNDSLLQIIKIFRPENHSQRLGDLIMKYVFLKD
jgi:hypothetical protein